MGYEGDWDPRGVMSQNIRSLLSASRFEGKLLYTEYRGEYIDIPSHSYLMKILQKQGIIRRTPALNSVLVSSFSTGSKRWLLPFILCVEEKMQNILFEIMILLSYGVWMANLCLELKWRACIWFQRDGFVWAPKRKRWVKKNENPFPLLFPVFLFS